MRLAVTGGTGFVGSNLLAMAAALGHEVRALTRRPQPDMPGVEWVPGALDDPASLARLAEGADAVLHVAGVISGDAEAFRSGNEVGTANMVAAARGVARFVAISSLAATLPHLSLYGASKAAAERPVREEARGWTILRPPAIYGPGDHELIELFRLARFRVIPVPRSRLSAIHVADLCRLILACAADPVAIGRAYAPDDGRPGGWPTGEFARAIGWATGRRVLALPLPKPLLSAASVADTALRGTRAKLTRDRVAYFTHPDWTVGDAHRPPASLWRPEIGTRAGLAETARWYRARGWL